MNPAPTPFDQLFEAYIFTVANHQIGSAERNLQAELFALWRTVSDTTKPDESFTESPLPQPTEWDAVLQKPIDWRSVNRTWLEQLIRERSHHHAKYLIRLRQAIAKTQFHAQAVEVSPLSEHIRARLLKYYQCTLHMYQQQLAHAERLQASYFNKLNRSKL